MEALLIPLTTFVAVVALGAAFLGIYGVMKDPIRARLRNLQGQTVDSKNASFAERALARVGSAVTKGGTSSKKLREELTNAGFHNPNALMIFLGSKMLLFVVGLVGCGVAVLLARAPVSQAILWVLIGATSLFFLPNIYVSLARRARCAEMSNALPDAIDLLEICVSGGMGLDMAWNAVAEDFRNISVPLADEMILTNLEMHLGEERGTAMRHMAERTGAQEISSLVGVLVQTEKFGTGVAEALRIFATDMRDMRAQKAEESAEKMAVKLLFPLILFIFPVILIVSTGPAVIILMRVLG